jgi:CHASE2 domain-containing sensor protein
VRLRLARGAALLGVAAICSAIALFAYAASVFATIEGDTINTRFTIRGKEPSPSNLVEVKIDDFTFAQLGLEWPFPRRVWAQLIRRISRGHPAAIAMDVQFSEASPGTQAVSDADEAPFLDALQGAHGKTVVSTTEVVTNPHRPPTFPFLKPQDIKGTSQGAAALAAIGSRAGYGNLPRDPGGVVRRMYYSAFGLDSFAVTAAEVARHHRIPRSRFGSNSVYVDFLGPAGTFHSLSFSTALRNKLPRDTWRNKIVVIGATSPSLQDLHATSTDSAMTGPEIQANAIETVLRGLPLRGAAGWLNVSLIILMSCAVPLLGLRLGPSLAPIVAAVLAAAFLVFAQLAFNSGTVVTVVYPLLGLVLSIGGTMAVGLQTETRERRRLRALFAANAPAIVDQVLSSNGPRLLDPTEIVAGYRIEARIGRGGMGVVYRAIQLSLDRSVALKLIAPERATDPVYRERFKLESRLAATIEHPNVIPVYEAGDDDGVLFIAMRLVEGIDLATLLARRDTIDPPEATALLAQLAAAIDAAHAHGLVHRDVKPANILLTLEQPEHVYLTDFGVAKRLGAGTARPARCRSPGSGG